MESDYVRNGWRKMSSREKYLQIYNLIKDKILNKFYMPNECIPSENQLAQEFDVSRLTVRKAIQKLITDNFLYVVQGKGTFVKETNPYRYEMWLDPEKIITTKVSHIKLLYSKIIKPDVDLVYNLQVAPKERVISIAWVLYAENNPIAVDYKYVPYFTGVKIIEKDLTYANIKNILSTKQSMFDMVEKVMIFGKQSTKEISEILNIDTGTPLLVIDQKVYDRDDTPLGWEMIYIKAQFSEVWGESII